MKFLALLLFTSSVFAHFEYDPHVFVDHVNVQTGDFVARVDDLTVNAVEPITIRRAYESSDGIWKIVPQKELILRGEKGLKGQVLYPKLDLYEPNGSRLTYREEQGAYELEMPMGFANTARGEVGGRTDLRNQIVEQVDKDTFHVTTPEKTLRIYKRGYQDKKDLVFLLQSEEMPNGNFLVYAYDSYGRLEDIKSMNPRKTRIYATCSLSYLSDPKRGRDFNVVASDGQKLKYRFSLLKRSRKTRNFYALTRVGEECLDYTLLNKTQGYALESWRGKPISYDQEGRVASFGGTNFDYLDEQTVVGPTIYHFNEKGQLAKAGRESFEWSEDGRLLKNTASTLRYDAFGNVVNRDGVKMAYDEDNRLIEKTDDKVTRYAYLKRTYLPTEVTLGNQDKVWLRTQYTYSKDHLLLQKSIDDGPEYTFRKSLEVDGPPHRPVAILEKGGDILLKLHTFRYEGNTAIEDSGDEERVFRYSPSISLLNQIELIGGMMEDEKNLPNGALIERDFFDRITKMEIYDNDGNLLQKRSWEYNTFFLVAETDPEGYITHYSYDEAGRKVKETLETEQGERDTLFFYNAQGLLERIVRGEVVTRLQYDDQHQLIDKWEEDLKGNLVLKTPKSTKRNPLHIPAREGALITYDLLGRLTELKTSDGSVHYSIAYNGRGEPTAVTDHISGNTGTRVYDAAGNLVEETFLNGQRVTSKYDLWSRRIEYTLPDHSKIYYNWGPRFLKEITRITSKQNFEYRYHLMDYNAFGFPETQRLIEGFGQCNFDMNDYGEITAIHSRHYDDLPSGSSHFEPDDPTAEFEVETDGLGRAVSFTDETRKFTFTYDVWNRRMTKKTYYLADGEWVLYAQLHYLYDHEKDIGAMRLHDDSYRLAELRVLAEHTINTGDQSIAYEFDGMPYAPLFDLDGNPKILLSAIRQKIMESYEYSLDGQERITDYWGDRLYYSKATNPWRYGTYRYDEDLGLYYIDGDYGKASEFK